MARKDIHIYHHKPKSGCISGGCLSYIIWFIIGVTILGWLTGGAG